MISTTAIGSTETTERGNSRASVFAIAGVLLVWLTLIIVLGARGVFESGPSAPPWSLLLAIVLPPSIVGVLYAASGRVREFALAIDLRMLTMFQAWRVVGATFLVLYALDLLPALFAYPAGIGDLMVGASAPFAAMAISTGTPGWRQRVKWLNVAGLADFAVALFTGVITSNNVLGFAASASESNVSLALLPLALIPTFGVPLFTIFHMIALLQLRHDHAGRAGA
jgi:hypothetical protein